MQQNSSFIKEREEMVSHLKRMGIHDTRVTEAMLKVPRHLFITPDLTALSYSDSALPINCSQTISQPYIIAFMTQTAELEEHYKVLEIGTGSGYQAAVLGEICMEVYTIEVIKQLADTSKALLNELGYKNIQTKLGNGYEGWKEASPFDVIIITAASKSVPSKLIEQLKIGGRMIMPLEEASGAQHLVKIVKTGQNQYTQKDLLDVRFVKMVNKDSK